MRQTLEQKRAQYAWEKAKSCDSKYVNSAKGLPVLIMNSGLMQAMAFLHEHEKDDHHRILGTHLREWLHEQCRTPVDFNGFMKALLEMETQNFQTLTAEAFAWLKWLRRIAPAVVKKEN